MHLATKKNKKYIAISYSILLAYVGGCHGLSQPNGMNRDSSDIRSQKLNCKHLAVKEIVTKIVMKKLFLDNKLKTNNKQNLPP